jgi:hypothetical protein
MLLFQKGAKQSFHLNVVEPASLSQLLLLTVVIYAAQDFIAAFFEENSFAISIEAAHLIFDNTNMYEAGQPYLVRYAMVSCELILYNSYLTN